MSRTYRRKGKDFVQARNAHYCDREYIVVGWCWNTWTERVWVDGWKLKDIEHKWKAVIRTPFYYPLSVPKRTKDTVKWQRDCGYSGFGPHKDFRQQRQRILRMEGKSEIHRFMKDDSYEIMALSKPPLPYWD